MNNIASLFNSIARQYDHFNHLTSMGIDKLWRRRAIRCLTPVEHILDVAIGTGDLALETIRQQKAQRITGIDLSSEMMAVGAKKVAEKGLTERICFQEASALDMPFEDNTFDALTCGYGVRNFGDLPKGLSEFHRVLKPGGQILILEFSYPQNPVIAWAYTFYFKYIMTPIGTLLTGDKQAFHYFFHSVRNFVWGEEMKARMEAAGFQQVTYRTLTFGISTIYLGTK